MRKKTYLNPVPARPLTSREIAKILMGTVGGFLGPMDLSKGDISPWCEYQAAKDALKWLGENADELLELYRTMAGFPEGRPPEERRSGEE